MFQDVDVIGIEAVVKLIQQSRLQKFMIFRKGAGKGSIPVFECMTSDSNAKCVQAFRDWAHSALNLNPHNILPYEILLYNKSASDADLENDLSYERNAPKDEMNAARRKENKIRFSFALNGGIYPSHNPYGQPGVGSVNVQEEIKRALDDYKREQEIKELKERIKELEEGDDDDDDDNSAMDRVTTFLKEIRLSKSKKKADAISGDDDDDFDDDDDLDDDDSDDEDPDDDDSDDDDPDDDDSDDEDSDDRKSSKTKKSESSKASKQKRILEQRTRLKKALRILMKKDPKLIVHLEKLSRLAVKNPMMFKTVLTNLDTLSI